MIQLFFTILSFVIIARVIFHYIGYNYGTFYDIVFNISERVLKPIRKRLPASPVDWSPLIALVLFDLLGKFLPLFVTAAVGGEWGAALYVLYYSILSTMSSVATLFIIIFVVKFFNDLTGRGNYTLTMLVEAAADPIVKRVGRSLPFGYRRYSFWVSFILIVLFKAIVDSQFK